MCPDSYSWEVRESAEELYIIDGQTYEQVADNTGVSISQLKRWGLDSVPTWTERRREYRQAQSSVRRNVMLAKAKLIESVIDSEDPQKAYAFSALVSSSKAINEEARERNQGTARQQPTEQPLNGETPAGDPVDMMAGLSLAMHDKISSMLTKPGALTATAIKELQQAMTLVETLKAKMAEQSGESDKGKGTSAQTIDQLRAAIMQELAP